MGEIITQEKEVVQDISDIAKNAAEELKNILSGKDFSTGNLEMIKNQLLDMDDEKIGQALDALMPAGKTNKSFEVEAQAIADYIDDIIRDPNGYRQKYPERIKSIIIFLQNL